MHAAVAGRGLASEADARAAPGAPRSSNGARVGDATRGPVEAREAWLDAFELQVTPAMLARVKRYALRRARMVARAGGEAGEAAADDLVQNALGDTFAGVLRWDPELVPLERYLLGVVRWRSRDLQRHHATVQHVSIDAVATIQEREEMLAELPEVPAGEHDERTGDATVAALQELAASDAGARAIVEAFASGASKRSDVLARTGISANDYDAARLRMIRVVQKQRAPRTSRARQGGPS
jgi:hypothetical protein